MKTAIRTARRLLDAALVALVLAVFALVLAANLGPHVGHELVIIRGSSMSPAIPMGSIVDLVRVEPADLRPGDVVTLKEPAGAIITHRIVKIAELPDGLYVETKGDANREPDAPPQPATVVHGRVVFSVPLLGFLMYLLTMPTGVASVFSLGLTMLLAIWLLEDLELDYEAVEEPAADGTSVSPAGAEG